MRKIMRTVTSLALALVLAASLAVTALAAEPTVTYRGKGDWSLAPGSGYTSTDLFDGFKNVMPGDKRSETITIQNTAKDCDYIKVYLQAVVHDEQGNPLTYSEPYEFTDGKDQAKIDGARDETVATMQDFLAQLTMRVWNGKTLLSEASPDELGGLATPVLLASLRSGNSMQLTVELDVPIELGNKYAHRVGEVDWQFTVEAFNDPTPSHDYTQLSVRKVWRGDDAAERPESITVRLLRSGKYVASIANAEVVLNEANGWSYTWTRLDDDYSWSVEEVDVPSGYSASYTRSGSVVQIVNTKDGTPPDDPNVPPPPSGGSTYLTVKKAWAGDADALSKRPDSVGITLYNGTTAVETVQLGAWNDWTYTWSGLDENGDWGVLEVVPKGYSPTYSVNGREITVTNTATLIQTGQLNWPIPVLGGLGALLVVLGAVTLLRKRKDTRA